ncbi:sensor histidine kinase [Chengkuizengella marina]|uniref:Sensor histidine kinase n=1 Tax=Chengkuizengella marina TaxID=2507566 RepID=A0A6N9Q2G0_9BACL|nr:sensor histidine kinase [Chengkuizengella marina]NBI28930.1 sensor histidine kinase [Chengkuizengella marina]
MRRYKKKLTNMIWKNMGESMIASILIFLIIIYFLETNEYIKRFEPWLMVKHSLTLFVIVLVIGTLFGFLQSNKIKKRLDRLHDSMLLLEKGNLPKDIPSLGEDEIGRLADQLSEIRTKWEDQITSLQRLSTNNAQLAEKARFSAVTEERQRLARELHDAVSQQLFAISMTATAVGRTLNIDFEKAKRQVSLIEEMASVAQSEMRALLLHLRPVHLEGKRLSQGLHELLHELNSKVPIHITLDMDDNLQLTKGVEDHIFRIIQEALSNTLRHSKASEMEIKCSYNGSIVRLMIQDNGVGFDMNVQKHASYGIVSMKERINEIGGSIQFITAPGKGTRIEIRIPVVSERKGEQDVYSN